MQELSQTGKHALFRDSAQMLNLLDVRASNPHMLMLHATYAQWVPGCDDVIVAQSACGDVMVWYGLHCLDGPQHMPVEGTVQHLSFCEVCHIQCSFIPVMEQL